MPLASGTQLGHYRITSLIGQGGMGEVYRAGTPDSAARSPSRFCPAHLANDPTALARFEREAKAVAALSHPNILVLYDVGSHEGIRYAVTELLEGETLRERLSAFALALAQDRGLRRSPSPMAWPPRTPRRSFIATSSRPTFF